MYPVMDVRTTNSGKLDVDEDIVGRLELRDRSVFELDTSSLFEDEGEILVHCIRIRSTTLMALQVVIGFTHFLTHVCCCPVIDVQTMR